MKRIRTLSAPTSGLARYLAKAGVSATWGDFRAFEGGAARIELVEAMANLQRGLCGYCEIDLTPEDRLIEHFVPRSHPRRGRSLELDHRNLLASCQGGSGRRSYRDGDELQSDRTCDRAKGAHWSRALLDPRGLPARPPLVIVEPDGTMVPNADACSASGVAARHVTETLRVLNLNAPRLKELRKEVWDELDGLWSGERDAQRLEQAVRVLLLPAGGHPLRPWFSTIRSFFGQGAEVVLAAESSRWI